MNLIRGARDCLIGSQNIFSVSSPASAFTGQRGRPIYLIPSDQLDFLISRCFSVVDIATLLGVRVRTVERHLFEFGLSVRLTYRGGSVQLGSSFNNIPHTIKKF